MLRLCGAFIAACVLFPDFGFGFDFNAAGAKYDLIESGFIHRSIVKRNAEGTDPKNYNRVEKLAFKAFGRDFHLYLTTRPLPLAAGFAAKRIRPGQHNEETSEPILIAEEEFYEGHVFGAPWSHVIAQIDEYGAITAVIHFEDNQIHVEPAWRHIEGALANQSVVYHATDVDLKFRGAYDNHKTCGYVQVDPDGMVNSSHFHNPDNESEARLRTKRQEYMVGDNEKSQCSLKLIADYSFYKNIGGSNDATTAKYLIELIDRVNFIFRKTVWRENTEDKGYSGLGFVIKEIRVLTDFQPVVQGEEHYNMLNSSGWSANKLLQLFSEAEGANYRDVCLVHLFTYRSFDNGILGLGYIAAPRIGAPGGICSGKFIQQNGGEFYANTALSSGQSSFGGPVITREADIVTAHEFGHNWGSPHDPDTPECSPSYAKGGAFIMYTYSLSGYEENNNVFSPCSKRSIKQVLDLRSQNCFETKPKSFCGNMLVEENEECDAGWSGRQNKDPCCSSDCKLRPGAICSPLNSPCCTGSCVVANDNKVCRSGGRGICKMESRCDGSSHECPPAKFEADGSSCRDGGECRNGTCMPFCQRLSIGLQPCICDRIEESCFRCCRRGNVCQPYVEGNGRPEKVPRGSRCIHGYCDEYGNCIKEITDLVERVWDIIENLDANAFVIFMRNNMVGTIIIVSLIIWIPCSCLVHRMDIKRKAECEKEVEFISSDQFSFDKNRIEVVRGVRHVHPNGNGAYANSGYVGYSAQVTSV